MPQVICQTAKSEIDGPAALTFSEGRQSLVRVLFVVRNLRGI
jgi:hypothetical protein